MLKFINKIKKMIVNQKYFFIIFLILFICYILYYNPYSYGNYYSYNYYVVSYNYGFISRGLIGSIFMFFFPFLKMHTLIIILNIIYILLLVFISYLLHMFIKIQKDKLLSFLATMLCIFNPASFMLMITMNEFGRFDIFIFILSIIAIIIICKKKFIFLVPIIFIIAMLIHQNFLFMYAPLILMIIIYNWFKKRERRWLILFFVY